MADLDAIRTALADPKAPWYGSDLVPMVADLVEEIERLRAELDNARTAALVLYWDEGIPNKELLERWPWLTAREAGEV